MFSARLRVCSAACLALLFAFTAPLPGCKKDGLTETTFPSDGVELSYDLQAGASFEGVVRRRENISSRGQAMNRSIEFSVQLSVSGVGDDGTARVAARVYNLNLNWNVPGLPISMNEFNAKAKAKLEGVTIRFGVKPDGSVIDVPATPPEFDEAEAGVLESVIDGLTAAFFVVPDKRLMAGEGWEDSDTRGREGKLGKYTVESVKGTMVGMFERRTDDKTHDVAKLEIDADKSETTTTKDGSSEIRTRSDTTVLFDPSGYMAVIESKQTRTQGATVTTVEFNATWSRVGAGTGSKQPGPGTDNNANVQSISDPCDDNYVGPDDCLDPCNSNYMGEEPCAEAAGEAPGGEALPAGKKPPCTADAECGEGQVCDVAMGVCGPPA
jgi:Cys-rich repeat protein